MRSEFCHTCFADLAPGEKCPNCGDDQSSAQEQGDVLRPGSLLGGKYQVGRLLGRGGFGATYLAWDTNLQVRIAIKEYLPRPLAARASAGTQVQAYTGSSEAFNAGLQQFLSEARNLAQFRDHPGIISVLDFFPENGTGYMVMEYLDGRTLEQYIAAAGRLDVLVALQILVPVADALRACHAAGLIHRDISPDNIFLTSDGRVKVLDFGASRFAIGARSTNLSVILKEGFAPFEQYQRNGRQGAWTDLYALTATLYRLVTDELPVTAPDRVGGTPMPTLAEKGVKVSPELQALLDKGMAIPSDQRYQTVEAFLSDLQALPEMGRHGSSPSDRIPEVVGLPKPKRPILPVAAGSIAALGVVALVVALLRSTPTPTPVKPGPPQQTTQQPPAQQQPSEPTPAQPQPQPRNSSTTPIEVMREYVRQAAQYQIQLRLALTQARGASNSLDRLRSIRVKNDTTNQLIGTEESLYNSAVADRENVLNRYMAQLDWLGQHDPAAVDTAVRLEHDNANTATIDKGDAESKAQIMVAVDLVAAHVRAQRQAQLSRAGVLADAERSNSGGTK